MPQLNYLNVGCGNKFHQAWMNVDMVSNSPYVKAHNLLEGLPFPNNQFDVVYHSQVLEHFPQERAASFVGECFRVLKPGGIMRVVVPDLENIVTEYLKYLHENLENPSKLSAANYDWLLLEMYDQTVRNYSGGQMAAFLRQPELINEQYIINRFGYIAKTIRNDYLSTRENPQTPDWMETAKSFAKHLLGSKMLGIIKNIFNPEAKRVGTFRLGGEVHLWMYDRYSLSKLLREAGYENIQVKTPFESDILHWETYELDVKAGAVFDPTSLFMEARKPT